MSLFGGELLSTFAFGLGHSLGPVFVAELVPSKIRGICLSLVVSLALYGVSGYLTGFFMQNTMIVLDPWVNSAAVLACSSWPDDMA